MIPDHCHVQPVHPRGQGPGGGGGGFVHSATSQQCPDANKGCTSQLVAHVSHFTEAVLPSQWLALTGLVPAGCALRSGLQGAMNQQLRALHKVHAHLPDLCS